MDERVDCPDEHVLRDFAYGVLEEPVAASVGEHLALCHACRAVLESFENTRAGSSDRPPGQTTPRSMPCTVELGSPEADEEDPEETQTQEFDQSLLAPSEKPGVLGRLGNYEVVGVVGHGGMGIVIKAFDPQLHRTVAVKLLAKHLAMNHTARRRFKREARAAAAINHPNVMTIHAVEEHDGCPILVMEYIAGRSLRQRIREDAPLELPEVLRLSAQIAAGLAAAHAQGVIHRDIKPANIILEDGVERVKIADFGLARVALDNAELTSQGHAVGTPAYMSPEQVLGGQIDARSDLFSLGCVMYAMVTRHSPFRGTHPTEIARKITDLEPPPLNQVDPNVPLFLSEIVERLLAKKPNDRFQTADEVARLLMDHLSTVNQLHSDELRATLLRRPPPPKPNRLRPHAKWKWAIAAAALVVVTLGSWQWWTSDTLSHALTAAGLVPGQTGLEPDQSDVETGQASPAVPRPPKTLTVGQQASAVYSTIARALADAQPGDTVEVLDNGIYEEGISLDNPKRYRGLHLISSSGATLRAPGKYAVIKISNTPEVVIHGFHIESTGNQHAVTITGPCQGTSLQDVIIRPFTAGGWALVHITQQAAGTPEQPIRLENSLIEVGALGIIIDGKFDGPEAHVRISNNRFRGEGKHLQLSRLLEDVQVTGNLFISGAGVIGNFPSADQAHDVLVANNTFFDCSPWLGRGDSATAQQGIAVCNNLILGSGSLAGSEDLAQLADQWSFRHNVWETGPDADAARFSPVARLEEEVHLLSRDPSNPDFLRPTGDSPLGEAGLGGQLPTYVGALAPLNTQP